MTAKLSISLSESDLQQLDSYVTEAGLPSRSAGVAAAIRSLRTASLLADYRAAFDERGDDAWDTTAGDGLE